MSKKMEGQYTSNRLVYTYSEMWHASDVMLRKAIEDESGRFYQTMASLVFTAFTFEAYLNHIGQLIFDCWDDLEKLSVKSKLNVIAEKIGLKIDYAHEPWQVITILYRFRNDIAHGKTVKLSVSGTITHDEYERKLPMPETDWEKYCSVTNSEKARKCVAAMCIAISEKVDGVELPFSFGLISASFGKKK